jgi:hypothetical protein
MVKPLLPDRNAVDRTWWLVDPVGVYQKFGWEFAQAFDNHHFFFDLRVACYHAMNAAITGWSLLDWIAADLTETDGWDRAAQAIGAQNKTELLQFARSNTYMAAIEQIAIATKHRTLNRGFKPGYRVTDEVASQVDGSGLGRRMMVQLPDNELDIRVVLNEADEWMSGLLSSLGY